MSSIVNVNPIMQYIANTTVGSEVKQTISDLKQIDTYLTEISKANNSLSKSELSRIGDNSFDVASKYGKTVTDYLAGVQEMSLAGYENADRMAELSAAAQGASSMTAELANQYIIATDRAFQMNGSIEALTQTLDGAYNITNNNAVNMTDLAEGISIVSAQAASSQMEVNEVTAAIGTLIAVTHESGTEMGNAFNDILVNLQQITGEVDGAVSLKEPMQILKELSEEYTKLDATDPRRTDLLSAVGGNDGSEALNALLENYDLYEKMLQDYANGSGSMAEEAAKTANSWEGSMNRLSNTWTSTISNIANSDSVIQGVNALNGVLGVVNNITNVLGSWGSIGLGAGLFAGIKNVGRDKMSSLTSVCLNMPTI